MSMGFADAVMRLGDFFKLLQALMASAAMTMGVYGLVAGMSPW